MNFKNLNNIQLIGWYVQTWIQWDIINHTVVLQGDLVDWKLPIQF